jgi:AraC-like DNA-binding protein
MKCSCGCGRDTEISKIPPYSLNKFIHGHARRLSMEKRFWNHVQKTDTCWLWTGKPNKAGYGRIALDAPNQQTTIMAHRYSYELHFDKIPDSLSVCHHCDNPICVRPDHLFAGTMLDNMQDMINKKPHFNRKVFTAELNLILELAKSNLTISDIARQSKLSRTTVRRILKNTILPPGAKL